MTLVEVLVALTLLALVTTAVVPVLVLSLKAGTVSKMDTGAKNLGQQRFEVMRNLPFRIAYDSSVVRSLDLLDFYYPDLSPAGDETTAGLVTSQSRRRQEPTTGPFYRTRWDVDFNGGTYTQWVAVQFLEPKTRTVLVPPTGYSTNSYQDLPPSSLVGVTVTTEWTVGTMSKQSSAFTQIADASPLDQLIDAEARATALRITSNLPSSSGHGDVAVEAGLLSLSGALGSGATAAASATGASASAFGSTSSGAFTSVSAPPDATMPSVSDTAVHDAVVDGAMVGRIPATKVEGTSAATSGGNPAIGTSSAPLRAIAYGTHDLGLWPGTDLPDTSLGLDQSFPAAIIPAVGMNEQVTAAGWTKSTGGMSHSVESRATSATQVVRVLPTTFAPEGLVQLRLESASVACTASGTGVSASAKYVARLRHWQVTTTVSGSGEPKYAAGYSAWIAMSDVQASDPLQGISLATDDTGVPVHRAADGSWRMLGHYFTALSSQTTTGLAGLVEQGPDGRSIESATTSMVTVATVPLRSVSNDSSVIVSLGAMSCVAGDRR